MKIILVSLDGSRSPRQVLSYVRLLAKVLGPRVRLLHILTGAECAAMIRSGHVPPRTAHGIRTTYRERKQYAWELLHEQDESYLATQAGIQAESDVGVDGRTEAWSSVRMLYRRVAGWHYCHPAPSEPYVNVSVHTAQASRSPLSGRGFSTYRPWLCT
jgi:hypothetical protein